MQVCKYSQPEAFLLFRKIIENYKRGFNGEEYKIKTGLNIFFDVWVTRIIIYKVKYRIQPPLFNFGVIHWVWIFVKSPTRQASTFRTIVVSSWESVVNSCDIIFLLYDGTESVFCLVCLILWNCIRWFELNFITILLNYIISAA